MIFKLPAPDDKVVHDPTSDEEQSHKFNPFSLNLGELDPDFQVPSEF